MHRRSEIDWALSNMTPKAVPAAPLPREADVDRSSLLANRDATERTSLPTAFGAAFRQRVGYDWLTIPEGPAWHLTMSSAS